MDRILGAFGVLMAVSSARIIATVAISLSLVACGQVLKDDTSSCSSDADCGGGFACSVLTGQCVDLAVDGPQGDAGPAGPQGDAGPAGPQGDAGAGCASAVSTAGCLVVTCGSETPSVICPEDGTPGTNGSGCHGVQSTAGCLVVTCGDETFEPICPPGVEPEPLDTDRDGIADLDDNCPDIANANQADLDADGLGDACDSDWDGDGIVNGSDNCPHTANPTQSDIDRDNIGDACDPTNNTDTDRDGIADLLDNCPLTANPTQSDVNGNGIGDACDTIAPPAPVCSTLHVASGWQFQGVVSTAVTSAGYPIGEWVSCPNGATSCRELTICEGQAALFNVQSIPALEREWAILGTWTGSNWCGNFPASVNVSRTMFVGSTPEDINAQIVCTPSGNLNWFLSRRP